MGTRHSSGDAAGTLVVSDRAEGGAEGGSPEGWGGELWKGRPLLAWGEGRQEREHWQESEGVDSGYSL